MMTSSEAKTWMLLLYIAALSSSLILGGVRQYIALMVLGAWYNNFQGADGSWITRNFINCLGYMSFASGSLEVALGSPLALENRQLSEWLLILGLIIFSTVQTQDMEDQEGDKQRGRRTMPLELGDPAARYITAFLILLWSITVPWYWEMKFIGYFASFMLGLQVICRLLMAKTVKDDKFMFWLWNLWVIWLYVSPLLLL